ncbi:MAG: toxin-antitoxin system TumE family protein [Blastocatellia bacterium]
MDFEPDSSTSGMIEGVIYFYDGSRLEVAERIKCPVKTTDVYQYVRAGESVFRYDNAPHHPGLSNFPHHKHVGPQRLSAIEPSLNQILDEIAEHFADAPPSKPRRRRQSKRSGSN